MPLTVRRLFLLVIMLLLGLVVAGTTSVAEAQDLPAHVKEQLQKGDDRVLLEFDSATERMGEMHRSEMFQDARQRLTENGYNLALVDEDLFTLETAPRRMEEGYVLRITVNVLTSADGVDLLSRAEWAQSKDAGEADWHEAAWTQGPSRAAFEQTILAVAEIPHTSMLVAKAAELADVSEMDGGTR